jgi:hypothetical protein
MKAMGGEGKDNNFTIATGSDPNLGAVMHMHLQMSILPSQIWRSAARIERLQTIKQPSQLRAARGIHLRKGLKVIGKDDEEKTRVESWKRSRGRLQ